MKKTISILLAPAFLLMIAPAAFGAPTLAEQLKGRILLQVESRGEAWYVNPDTLKRIYLADGDSAYQLLRDVGLGITDDNLSKIPVGIETRFQDTDTDNDGLADKLEEALKTDVNNPDTDSDGYADGVEVLGGYNPLGSGRLPIDQNFANGLKGKILLQVESRGEAWYVYPVDGKRYYMKDGDAAYQIMRYLSLGITNADLEKIEIDNTSINSLNKSASGNLDVELLPTDGWRTKNVGGAGSSYDGFDLSFKHPDDITYYVPSSGKFSINDYKNMDTAVSDDVGDQIISLVISSPGKDYSQEYAYGYSGTKIDLLKTDTELITQITAHLGPIADFARTTVAGHQAVSFYRVVTFDYGTKIILWASRSYLFPYDHPDYPNLIITGPKLLSQEYTTLSADDLLYSSQTLLDQLVTADPLSDAKVYRSWQEFNTIVTTIEFKDFVN